MAASDLRGNRERRLHPCADTDSVHRIHQRNDEGGAGRAVATPVAAASRARCELWKQYGLRRARQGHAGSVDPRDQWRGLEGTESRDRAVAAGDCVADRPGAKCRNCF